VLEYCAGEKAVFFSSRRMVLTREQRIFDVKHFRNESYALCQEAFQEAFPNDTVPNRTIVYLIITKCEETGSV
jgi:hypothetical protein